MKDGHYVHYYKVQYEDGTTDILPGYFAYGLEDVEKPCIECGKIPRKRIIKLCEQCIKEGK